jgi:hypothetical protein
MHDSSFVIILQTKSRKSLQLPFCSKYLIGHDTDAGSWGFNGSKSLTYEQSTTLIICFLYLRTNLKLKKAIRSTGHLTKSTFFFAAFLGVFLGVCPDTLRYILVVIQWRKARMTQSWGFFFGRFFESEFSTFFRIFFNVVPKEQPRVELELYLSVRLHVNLEIVNHQN